MAQTSMQKLIDAGVQFGVTTRKQAKATVKQLVKDGELRRKEAADYVDALVERSREATERMNAAVQEEVSKLTAGFHERMAEMESQIQSLIAQIPGVGHDAQASKSPAAKTAAKKASGGQPLTATPAKAKAPANKSVAKKAVAKTAAKKAPAAKAPVKKAAAKTVAAKKVAAKKVAAKAGGASTSTSTAPKKSSK